MLEGFVKKMEDSINEIRKSYEELISRFESKIKEVLSNKQCDFIEYQELLIMRLSSINPTLLNSRLRNIHRKCINPTTDRKMFLEGIAYAILGKSLENIDDEEEEILYKGFSTNYNHLLELVDIHKIKETHQNDALAAALKARGISL